MSEPYSSEADALLEDLRERGSRIMAPGLVAYEATRVCYKRVQTGDMSIAAATRALSELLATLTDIEHDQTLHEQAMQLADKVGLTATYDAHYMALAEREGCELWTADKRLWNAVRDALPYVRWIGEYQLKAV